VVASRNSMATALQDQRVQLDDANGELKGLKSKVEALEKTVEKSVSVDEVGAMVKNLSKVQAKADYYKVDYSEDDGEIEIMRKVAKAVDPDTSYDDAELPGMWKTLKTNVKDTKEMIASRKSRGQSNDDNSQSGHGVSLSQIDAATFFKRKM
jgi:ribosomal protein S20